MNCGQKTYLILSPKIAVKFYDESKTSLTKPTEQIQKQSLVATCQMNTWDFITEERAKEFHFPTKQQNNSTIYSSELKSSPSNKGEVLVTQKCAIIYWTFSHWKLHRFTQKQCKQFSWSLREHSSQMTTKPCFFSIRFYFKT